MNLVADAGEGFTRSIDGHSHNPRTVAYWRFEDQPVGTLVPDSGGGHKPVRGTIDCSGNGNDLFTWSPATAPRFSADVPAVAVARTGMADRGSLDNSAPLSSVGSRDLYTKSLFTPRVAARPAKDNSAAVDDRGLGKTGQAAARRASLRRPRRERAF